VLLNLYGLNGKSLKMPRNEPGPVGHAVQKLPLCYAPSPQASTLSATVYIKKVGFPYPA